MSQSHKDAVAEHLGTIEARIVQACERAGRPRESVTLLAVSKGHEVEELQAAYDCGLRFFGESYVQEWRDKVPLLPDDVVWHFIGRLQSNKLRFLAQGPVACVESIGRVGIAEKLAARCAAQGSREGTVLPVMAEVNLGEEAAKGGTGEADAVALVQAIDALPALRLVGLMAIPPWCEDPEDVRPYFRRLRELRDRLNAERPTDSTIPHLSMGMSHDFEVAIEEGATVVRVGTALFGPRRPRRKG